MDTAVGIKEAKTTTMKPKKMTWKEDFKKNKVVYLMFLPIIVYFLIFNYAPLFGLTMAFQDFEISKGIFGSKFIGFENFKELFTGAEFGNALKNTVIIGLFNLVLGFPAAIVFAFIVTNIKYKRLRRGIQTISYTPNFIAPVVVCTLLIEFCGQNGAITTLLGLFGVPKQNLLANPNPPMFWFLYAFSGVWQSFGWGSIIYVASLMNVNNDLFEAAAMDGASKGKIMWKISLPSIMPIIIMLFTVQVGITFRAGFDRILLLYMPGTYPVADTLFTYTYRMAFGKFSDYGLSTASGLFQSVVGTIMLFGSNFLSKKVTNMSLF